MIGMAILLAGAMDTNSSRSLMKKKDGEREREGKGEMLEITHLPIRIAGRSASGFRN